jgi:hypothetical protein
LGFLIFQKALSRLEKQSKTLWAFRKTVENNLCLWKHFRAAAKLLKELWVFNLSKSFESVGKAVENTLGLSENC